MRFLLFASVIPFLFLSVFGDLGDYTYRADSVWGGTCDSGKRQSPINLIWSKTERLSKSDPVLKINTLGTASKYKVFLTGVNLEIELEEFSIEPDVKIPANEYTIGDSKKVKPGDMLSVEPLQFHFHTISEHSIAGRHTAAELHIVCKVKDGESDYCDRPESKCLVVFGVLLQYDKNDLTLTNPTIDLVFSQAPRRAGKVHGRDIEMELELDTLFPEKLGYFTYLGSLTTPGCDEVVTWYVFVNPLPISVELVVDHQKFVSLAPGTDCSKIIKKQCFPPREKTNFRNVQELNGRVVYFGRAAKVSSLPT